MLPENFSTGADFVNFQKTSENKFGGGTIAKICEFAQKYKTNIVAGTVIEKDGINVIKYLANDNEYYLNIKNENSKHSVIIKYEVGLFCLS